MANIDVALDVRNFSNSTPGFESYTNSTSNTGVEYCYRYTGGTDGNGDVTEYTGQGAATVTVSVTGNFSCNVYNVEFEGDPAGELSWTWGNIPQNNIAIIADADTSNEDGYYSVIVQDLTQSNTTIPCDPKITTKPP